MKSCKTLAIIVIVLFVCAILALVLSNIAWIFLGIEEETKPHETSINATGTAGILVFCGILAIGLPATVWRYYETRVNEPKSLPTLSSMPTVVVKDLKMNRTLVSKKRIVGYYLGTETKDIRKYQLEKLTHVVFAFVQIDSAGILRFKDDKQHNRFMSLKMKAKSVKSDVKMMFSIGGHDNSEYFSQVIADSKKQRTFIDCISSFLKTHQLEGVDIFWKWPKESDKFKYTEFLKKLRETFKNQYVISIVAPPTGIENWECGFDSDEILENVDFINVNSMDFYGPWDNQWGTPAGPIAPLYSGVGARVNFNVDYTIRGIERMPVNSTL